MPKRDPSVLYCDDPSLTQQHFKEDCDINEIIARASRGAMVSHVNERVQQYGDFTNVPDYATALNLVSRANGMFMSLDANVRERFANDPARMISFLQDPKNLKEAEKLGLVVPKADVGSGQEAAAPSPEVKPKADSSGGIAQ